MGSGRGKGALPPKPNRGQHPHFMRDVYKVTSGYTPLNAVWTAVKVMWWPRDGRALVVMPTNTPSRVVIVGTPFVPVPADLRVLIPVRDQPGHYKDARAQMRRRFWVSMHTADPFHLLIDWEVGATLAPEPEVALQGSEPLSLIDKAPEVDTFDELKTAIWKEKS